MIFNTNTSSKLSNLLDKMSAYARTTKIRAIPKPPIIRVYNINKNHKTKKEIVEESTNLCKEKPCLKNKMREQNE